MTFTLLRLDLLVGGSWVRRRGVWGRHRRCNWDRLRKRRPI